MQKFGAQAEIVQFIWWVVDVQQERLLVGGTGRRSGIAAKRSVWSAVG
jgi:hypothetical protein